MSLRFLLLLLLAVPQAKASAAAGERIVFTDRSEFQGSLVGLRDGRLAFRTSDGKDLEAPIEEVARLGFAAGPPLPAGAAGEQIRLNGGGLVSGRLQSFDGEIATLESAVGTLRVRRRSIKSFLLAPHDGALELKNEGKDALVRVGSGEGKAAGPPVIEYGKLLSIGDKVRFQIAASGDAPAKDPEIREFDRAAAPQIHLDSLVPLEGSSPGWFAKVTLRNGDRWVGLLESVAQGKLRLFSAALGAVELDASKLHSITFVPQSRLEAGNLLVTDQMGVHEYDARGNALWEYQLNVQGASIARKLPSGNVLVVCPQFNQVIEIHPIGRAGGEVVWRLEELQMPSDAVRLDNGNTLVADRLQNRVAEYDAKTHDVVWQVTVPSPLGLQRLENGNTLITSPSGIVEVDRACVRQWEANLQKIGTLRPFRATRLENGNTLIVDQQRRQVLEISPDSAEVWRSSRDGIPVAAIRLEDGHTLVLEQGTNQIVELDERNPPKGSIVRKPGLLNPQGLTVH